MARVVPVEAAARYKAACELLGAPPAALAGVLYAESGWYPTAHNPNGHASGLFQAMPATLSRLGYHPSLPASERAAKFRTLSLADQIPWMAKYYMPYRGKLVNTAACYLATFTPAFLAHASEPDFCIAAKNGVRGFIYNANAAFDADRNLRIEVRELSQAVGRACSGDRWAQICVDLGVPHSGAAAGTRNRSVQRLQTLLWVLHVDGLYGPKTHAALVAFQRSAGLKPDGIAGVMTWAALEARAAADPR